MGAELVLSLRERELSRTPITHTRVTLGRDTGCDVVIDNAGVSRNHAEIIYLDHEFRVRDNNSQNGITVNGKPVKDCALNYGDVIGIGKFEIKLLETPDDFDRELEQGSAKRQAGPRNVMGTMQMNAVAVAGLRDQIAAQKAAVKRSQNANGAAPKQAGGKSVGERPTRRERPPRPTGDRPQQQQQQKERAAAAAAATTPPAAPAPAPARAPAAAAVSDPPLPPTNSLARPIAIGVAVAVALAVALLIFR